MRYFIQKTTFIFLTMFCMTTCIKPEQKMLQRDVLTFFEHLLNNPDNLPNPRKIQSDELAERLESMYSSAQRIVSLLKYNPKPVTENFIYRFFSLYSIFSGKKITPTTDKKETIWAHEVRHFRRQQSRFKVDLDKAMLLMRRDDDLTLQMAYDTMIVNTFFRQIFSSPSFQKASLARRFTFNLKHNTQTQVFSALSLTATALAISTTYLAYALHKAKEDTL